MSTEHRKRFIPEILWSQKEGKKGVEKASDIRLLTIVIPTYNEVNNIGNLQTMIHKQRENLHGIYPHVETSVVISDNGSTDETRKMAEEIGTVVTGSHPRSRGSARNVGFEAALNQNSGEAKSQILVSADADTVISNNDYLRSIYEAFSRDQNLMVSYGPFSFMLSGGQEISLPTFALNYQRYRNYQKRFKMFGRDKEDFIHPPFDQIFQGFNFAIRGNAYLATDRFTHDPTLMEDYLLTLELKRLFDTSQILFNKKQSVITSARAFESPEGRLSLKRITSKIAGRYTSHGEEVTQRQDNYSTRALKTFIDKTERNAYGLTENQKVLTIVTQRELDHMSIDRTTQNIRVAINHTTGEEIPGKYAILTTR